jgi:serine-type D-Ala-D-Ala carboxypeptidase (penicillin-binding protein 5/6)
MVSRRYFARVVAMSLTLTAAGACWAAPPSFAGSAEDPVGGSQLASRGVIVNLRPGIPPPPAMPGSSYLLADMDTGQVLAAKAPHTRHLPASTLKTLTALTVIPLLDAKTKVRVKPEDVNVDGTRFGLLVGTSYSIGTLLQGMLITSGNDAANALARANQSMAVTVQEMNATAQDLHASDTVAKDPSGLDQAGQHSSAYDLALIGRAAMRLSDFRGYVRTRQASLPGGTSAGGLPNPGFQVANHNTLLFNYRGAIGIKNGYTVAAKFTYIEAATRAGKTYLLTEMASPDGSWHPAAALLDWAFAYGASVAPIGVLVDPGDPVMPKPALAAGARPPSLAIPGPAQPAAAALEWAFASGPSLAPIGAPARAGDLLMPKPTLAAGAHPQVLAMAALGRSDAPSSTPWIAVTGGIAILAWVGSFSWRRNSRRRH